MFSFLTKKKISEERIAASFVNSLLKTVDEGFPEVAELINEDPEFVQYPNIDLSDSDEFLKVIFAGNLSFIPLLFNDYQDVRLLNHIYRMAGDCLDMTKDEIKEMVACYQSYIKNINQPSKNTHYGMSKAVFHKYDLNRFQDDYFRKMNTPNPIFLKRLDDIIANFIWEWEPILDKYKITES